MAERRIGRRGVMLGAGLAMAGVHGGLAAPVKPRVLIKTNHGSILVELEAEKAPITSTNFLRYVDAKAYDGGTFYRAVKDADVPGGGTIVGGPNPKFHPFPPIRHESTTKTGLRHVAGTLSLGRFDPGSATNNFFICAGDEPYLDAHPGAPGDNLGYAAFGQVVQGMDVVHVILNLPAGGATKWKEQRGEWLKPKVPILSMKRA